MWGFLNGTTNVADTKLDNQAISKIDYPLIEINFDGGSDWVVVKRDNLFQKEVFSIIDDETELQYNKEFMYVFTFPTGRGTTPNGIIYIYRDGSLVKEVPYTEISFEKQTLENLFRDISEKELCEVINGILPSPI